MKVENVIIKLNAAVFLLYGMAFIFLPELMSQYVTGGAPVTASGLIDMRATYGGMSFSVGALLFLLGARKDQIRIGLLGVVVIMLSMASGRLLGILVDGVANQIMYVYLALELAVAGVAGWALARQRRA